MENLDFWMAAGAITVGVAGLLVLSMRGAKAKAPEQSEAQREVQIYRDQLREVERDLARNVISAPDGERLKLEIARRLLDADKRVHQDQAQAKSGFLLPGLCVVAAGLGAIALYNQLGLPNYPDMPLAQRLEFADQTQAKRPNQSQYLLTLAPQAEPELPESINTLLQDLRRIVDPKTSEDLQGLGFLITYEAMAGKFDAAIAAQNRVIELKADATSAADYAALAELYISQAKGYVSPEAEEALRQSLQLNPNEELSRYYLGWIYAQSGRFDRAFVIWRKLYEESAPSAPWMPNLYQDLQRLAPMAGVNYTPDPLPTAQGAQNPQSLSADERAVMIEGMVAQLSDRLASEGGSVEEWAQLIGSLAVLERFEQAKAIYAEAQSTFANRPKELAILNVAAQNAGIVTP